MTKERVELEFSDEQVLQLKIESKKRYGYRTNKKRIVNKKIKQLLHEVVNDPKTYPMVMDFFKGTTNE